MITKYIPFTKFFGISSLGLEVLFISPVSNGLGEEELIGCVADSPATGEVGFSGDESSCSEELIMIGEVSLSTWFWP